MCCFDDEPQPKLGVPEGVLRLWGRSSPSPGPPQPLDPHQASWHEKIVPALLDHLVSLSAEILVLPCGVEEDL